MEQLKLQLRVHDVLSSGSTFDAFLVVVSDEETKEGVKVGNPPCRDQERGVDMSISNRLGGHYLGRVVSKVGPLVWVLGRPKGKKMSLRCLWAWVGKLKS